MDVELPDTDMDVGQFVAWISSYEDRTGRSVAIRFVRGKHIATISDEDVTDAVFLKLKLG
jgi:hypothetical protein